jgi:hypothetical protein
MTLGLQCRDKSDTRPSEIVIIGGVALSYFVRLRERLHSKLSALISG